MNIRRVFEFVRYLAVIVALSASARFARADFETPTVITNVTLVNPDGSTTEGASIVFNDGRIVGAGKNITAPANAEVVEGLGLFAYPGFIDAQSYLGIPEKQRTREERALTEDLNPDLSSTFMPGMHMAGRKGVRPQIRAIEQYVPDDKKLESYRAAGFGAVLIAPREGIFSGTSDFLSLSGEPVRRSVLASDVGMHASFSTGEDGGYPETILGVFAQFRQTLLDARWHAKLLKYQERHPNTGKRVARDAALDALQPMLARTQRVIFEANSDVEIRRALDLAAEFNLSPVIAGGREAWKVIDRLKAERVPLIINLKFDEEPTYGKKKDKKDERKEAKKEKGPGEQPEQTKPVEGEPLTKKPESKPGAPNGQAKEPDAAPKEKGLIPEGEKKETEKKDIAKKDVESKEEAEHKGEEKKEGDKEKEPAKQYEPLEVQQERRRLWEEQIANIIRLHEAGVPFAIRTKDFREPAELFKNLRLAIDRGLPEQAAVAALTTSAAELLGAKGQIGELAQGQAANVVLMDKRLTDEKTKVKIVFVDGKKFEIDEEKKKDKDKKDDEDKSGDEKPKVDEKKEAGEKKKDEEKSPDDVKKYPSFAAEVLADRLPTTKTGGNVLIQNATIIPVTSPTLEHASILIQKGKIAAIGKDLTAPASVTVIDGTEKFVIPGIIDCHSHLGIDGVNEGAHSISAEVRIADVIDPHDLAIYRACAGGVTTHHAMHGSANTIGGQCVVFKLKYERPVSEMLIPTAPRTIKFALGENVKQSNFFSAYGKRYPNTRLGVEAVIRGAFEAAHEYRDEWDDYEKETKQGLDVAPLRRDLKLDALSDVLAGKITVHCHSYRSDEILRLIDVAEEYGIRIGVWHHVLEGYRIAPEIARHGSGGSTFANMWAYKVEAYGAIPYNAAFMTQAGICSTVNSDSANTIRYLNQEAAKCIRWGGLDEIEALKLVTLNAARQLQIDDRVGSLEVGKDGDLAIFNGHPLNTFSKNVMTIIDGEVFFEDVRPQATEVASGLPIYGLIDQYIPSARHRGAYAIVGATVHPISSPPIENATVVVVDDQIEAVGKDVVVPPGAGVIQGKGLHVYPGLIDCGSVLGLNEIDSIRSTRDQSEIGTFNPNLITANAVHSHSEHIRIARTTGITTTLTKPSGGRISGQSSIIHLDGWTAPEMMVERAYGLHLTVPSLPYDPVESSEGNAALTSREHGVACCVNSVSDQDHEEIDFNQLRGGPEDEARKKRKDENKKAMKELEDFLAKATQYAKVKELAAKDSTVKFEVDLTLEAMVPYVRGDKPVVFAANGYKHILDTIEFAEKHKLKCVLSGGDEAWKLASTLVEKKIPVILGTPYGYPASQFEPWDSVYRCAGELDKAGVQIAFASDSSSDAYNLGIETGMAVAHGLSRERAEYALTLGAAEILGIADRLGSIEAGKKADLIVTTDSPLQSVSLVTHMFIDGRPIELTSMQTMEYEKFINRPAPKLPPPRTDLRGPKSLTKAK